jgi:hypothetical protein
MDEGHRSYDYDVTSCFLVRVEVVVDSTDLFKPIQIAAFCKITPRGCLENRRFGETWSPLSG